MNATNTQMSEEQMKQELARLRAENTALKQTSAKGLSMKISEKAMKYHFLLRKSIFGLRKNSTLNNPSVVRPWSCVVRLEPSPAVSSLFRLAQEKRRATCDGL